MITSNYPPGATGLGRLPATNSYAPCVILPSSNCPEGMITVEFTHEHRGFKQWNIFTSDFVREQ